MPHDVFISYSHKDSVIADAICHRFEEESIRCWYAPRDIKPGQEWAGSIITALESSRVMILVFTDFSNVSSQVHREVDAAVSAGVTIIPFKCTVSNPSEGMKYYLSTLHWLDAVDKPLEQSIEKLLLLTTGLLSEEEKPKQEAAQPKDDSKANINTPVPETKPRKWSKLILPITAALAVFIVAGVVIGILKRGSEVQQPAAQQSPSQEQQVSVSTPVVILPSDELNQAGGGADAIASTPSESKYVFDESNDSPHAEDYLYSVSEYYGNGDGYEKSVRLELYFGDGTGTIVVPEIIDGLPVTEIYEKCFYQCANIEKVVLPQTLEYIEYCAFYDCGALTEIEFPASLVSIGSNSFSHTGLIDVVIPDTVSEIGDGAFYGCPKLETVVVSKNVTTIERDTFRENSQLREITFRGEMSNIDIDALRNSEQATIIGLAGSYAETYAKAKGMEFKAYNG